MSIDCFKTVTRIVLFEDYSSFLGQWVISIFTSSINAKVNLMCRELFSNSIILNVYMQASWII